MSSPTTVYRARHIVTMHPARPDATHVAVREGRVLGVGSLDDVAGWGPHTLDERFADAVLMPGLVEGHSHLMAGTLWRYAYVGYFDVTGPDGRVWPGLKSLEAVVAALQQAFQSILLSGRTCTFKLNGTVSPGTEADGEVTLDGNKLTYKDPNGWILNAAGELELQGSACTSVLSTDTPALSIRFPCGAFVPR